MVGFYIWLGWRSGWAGMVIWFSWRFGFVGELAVLDTWFGWVGLVFGDLFVLGWARDLVGFGYLDGLEI